jgi:glycosyltransferase involved in cell wall biosynthesis
VPRPEERLVVGYVLRKFPKLSETFVLNEILGLESLGVKVQIFSLLPPRDPRFHEGLARLKAPVWYVPGFSDRKVLLRTAREARRRYGGRYWRTLARVLSSGRPTLYWRFLQAAYIAERAARRRVVRFHAHFATRATTVAGLVSSISGLPYSFTAHAVDIYRHDVSSKVLKKKVAQSDLAVTVSQANVEHLGGLADGSRDKIVLVHNGIDVSKFAPRDKPGDAPFTILCVARLVEKKGCEYLIDACAYLAERGAPFRCWIIGRGNLRRKLLAQIDRLDLGDRVRLLGGCTQKQVLKRYHAADLYVLPSIVGSDGNREGLPVSLVEALACGIPVVSTATAGIPEVVRDEQNGLLVPERDSRALAGAMARLIEDRQLYDRLRTHARSSVEGVFDIERTSAELRRLFAGGRK